MIRLRLNITQLLKKSNVCISLTISGKQRNKNTSFWRAYPCAWEHMTWRCGLRWSHPIHGGESIFLARSKLQLGGPGWSCAPSLYPPAKSPYYPTGKDGHAPRKLATKLKSMGRPARGSEFPKLVKTDRFSWFSTKLPVRSGPVAASKFLWTRNLTL
jgi:hypothetical protein